MRTLLLLLLVGYLFPVTVFAQRIIQYQGNNLELVYLGKRYSYLVPHMVDRWRMRWFHQKLGLSHSKTHVADRFSVSAWGQCLP